MMRLWFLLSIWALALLWPGIPLHAQDEPVGHSVSSQYTKVSRRLHAFDYRQRNRTISVALGGTALMPKAQGRAKVQTSSPGVQIETRIHDLSPASSIDPAQLTYVLWAVATDGSAQNLGELQVTNGQAALKTSTNLPAFAMMVTAEPYFAVKHPSDYIVLYNLSHPKNDDVLRADLLFIRPDSKTPLDLYEARNAVRIARQAGAERYATEPFHRAVQLLQQAESFIAMKKHHERGVVEQKAREATEAAEDARTEAERHQQNFEVR